MTQATQVEWDAEMNSNTAVKYPDHPAPVLSDRPRTKGKVQTRESSSLSRVAKQRTSKRSPSLEDRVEPTWSDGLQQKNLQELFLTSRKRFVRIACRILGNNEDAEDAVQDAFLSACRHLTKFEGRAALTTWFTRIVTNAALMVRRKRKNTAHFASRDTDTEPSFAETFPDPQPNPELACSLEESCEILESHLKGLNSLLREAIVTTYHHELSVAEASAVIGVSPGTYKARLFRGRRLLQKRVITATKSISIKPKSYI
jgi:RNA polymerase sigma-70 factor (ECF subfamily)